MVDVKTRNPLIFQGISCFAWMSLDALKQAYGREGFILQYKPFICNEVMSISIWNTPKYTPGIATLGLSAY